MFIAISGGVIEVNFEGNQTCGGDDLCSDCFGYIGCCRCTKEEKNSNEVEEISSQGTDLDTELLIDPKGSDEETPITSYESASEETPTCSIKLKYENFDIPPSQHKEGTLEGILALTKDSQAPVQDPKDLGPVVGLKVIGPVHLVSGQEKTSPDPKSGEGSKNKNSKENQSNTLNRSSAHLTNIKEEPIEAKPGTKEKIRRRNLSKISIQENYLTRRTSQITKAKEKIHSKSGNFLFPPTHPNWEIYRVKCRWKL